MLISKPIDRPHLGAWNVITGPNGSGKSRYLGQLADGVIGDMFASRGDQYSRLVCLSGTVFDRFPKSAYEVGSSKSLIYLGHKTNHNMFSAISPFRRLIPEILRSRDHVAARYDAASNLLMGLGLEGRVRVKFKQGRNSKDKRIGSGPTAVDIQFARYSAMDVISWGGIAENLVSGEMHVSEVQFVKDGRDLSLDDLSSGERGYILAGLAFCFCAINNSLVLFDEPENSLHPEWQGRIIQDLDEVLRALKVTTTVVVATHSPLVAASVPNKNGYICDLRTDGTWKRLAIFGMNADNVLSEQFGLRSARSAEAVDVIQKCLTLIANGQEQSDEFTAVSADFLRLDLRLAENDPLFRTVRTIKTIIEAES